MTAHDAAARKPKATRKPAPGKPSAVGKQLATATAAKHQRVAQMLRDLRSDAETLLANANTLLNRVS